MALSKIGRDGTPTGWLFGLERLRVGDGAFLGEQLLHVVEVDPLDGRVALGVIGDDVDRGEGSAAEDAGVGAALERDRSVTP